jgi:hypothetical protein
MMSFGLTNIEYCRSKYFRGKRLHGDYDIRVEQAEFKELSLTACADTGTMVSMAVFRNGTKVVRSFRPDFVLIRQNLKDAGEDYKNLLLGFKFGGVPSINNINAIYNFQACFKHTLSFSTYMYFHPSTSLRDFIINFYSPHAGQALGVRAFTANPTTNWQRQLPADRSNLLPRSQRHGENFSAALSFEYNNA